MKINPINTNNTFYKTIKTTPISFKTGSMKETQDTVMFEKNLNLSKMQQVQPRKTGFFHKAAEFLKDFVTPDHLSGDAYSDGELNELILSRVFNL